MKYIIAFLLTISICISNQSNDDCIEDAYNKYKNSKLNESFNQLKGCEESILDSDEPRIIARYYHGLASCYRKMDHIDSALKYQNLSVLLKEKYNFRYALSDNYNELALIYKQIGIPNKAIFYLNRAVKYNREHSPELLYINYLNLANCYENLDILDTAIRFNLLALNSKHISLYNKTVALFNLSDTYNKLLNKQKSYNYLNEAINIQVDNSILKQKLLATLNIMNIKYNKDYDSKPIFEYFKMAKNISHINYSKFCISILKLQEGDLQKSTNFIKQIINSLENEKLYSIAVDYINSYLSYANYLNIEISDYIFLSTKRKELSIKKLLKDNKEYQNDLSTLYKNTIVVKKLSNKIQNAEMNNKILIGVLILTFFIGNITFIWYRKHRIVKFLSNSILNLRMENQKSNKFIINNLAKVMFVLHYKLDEDIDKDVFIALDNSINKLDENNQKLTFYSNKIEEKYDKTESTI